MTIASHSGSDAVPKSQALGDLSSRFQAGNVRIRREDRHAQFLLSYQTLHHRVGFLGGGSTGSAPSRIASDRGIREKPSLVPISARASSANVMIPHFAPARSQPPAPRLTSHGALALQAGLMCLPVFR